MRTVIEKKSSTSQREAELAAEVAKLKRQLADQAEDLAILKKAAVQKHFTATDHAFLMSFKSGDPDWTLFDYPHAADLPAIRWKLQNIIQLAKNQAKHAEQTTKLKDALDGWLANAGTR